MTNQEAIDRILPKARELNSLYGFHVSMTLMQVMQESGWLKYAPGNNFLGIKVPTDAKGNISPTWPADKKQLLWTSEWKNGAYVRLQCWFVKYASLEECMNRYAKILLLDRYTETRASVDWYDSTYFISHNGYATSPGYTFNLRNGILLNKLYKYDWKQDPYSQVSPKTPNIQWWETYSHVMFNNIKYRNIFEPLEIYKPGVIQLAEVLQPMRTAMNTPFDFSNWYRIYSYNGVAGGVEDSKHRFAIAADIKPRNGNRARLFELANKVELIHGLGVGSDWMHLDIRKEYKRIWYY